MSGGEKLIKNNPALLFNFFSSNKLLTLITKSIWYACNAELKPQLSNRTFMIICKMQLKI